MESEEWRTIEEFKNYKVSSLGRVRNDKLKRDITLTLNRDGYYMAWLYDKERQKRCLVNRLVALAFIPNLENKPETDHINRIRTDNRVENLRWVTSQENKKNMVMPLGKTGHRHIMMADCGSGSFRVNIRRSWGVFQKCFKTLEEAIRARDEFLK